MYGYRNDAIPKVYIAGLSHVIYVSTWQCTMYKCTWLTGYLRPGVYRRSDRLSSTFGDPGLVAPGPELRPVVLSAPRIFLFSSFFFKTRLLLFVRPIHSLIISLRLTIFLLFLKPSPISPSRFNLLSLISSLFPHLNPPPLINTQSRPHATQPHHWMVVLSLSSAEDNNPIGPKLFFITSIGQISFSFLSLNQ